MKYTMVIVTRQASAEYMERAEFEKKQRASPFYSMKFQGGRL
ncbi:hypothetical protein [Paenibacillus sp. JJ-100]|nr:hypothetical protein [Paenibacillus sp. JJ-100]